METPAISINWDEYKHLFKEMEVPAKTILLDEGQVSRNAYFIKKGCIRLWFNNKGKDVTFQFFFENEGVSSIESFRSGEPSLFSIETIEPSTILMISKKNFEKIFMQLAILQNYFSIFRDDYLPGQVCRDRHRFRIPTVGDH